MNKKNLILLGILLSIFLLCVYYFYPHNKLDYHGKIDKIQVLKSKRKLLLLNGKQIINTYTISLGKNPVGAKEKKDDLKTPEGLYRVSYKQVHPKYHRALAINYPNERDNKNGRTGSGILIHGINKDYRIWGRLHRWRDWTEGCIALTNEEMEEIYSIVSPGTQVEILP